MTRKTPWTGLLLLAAAGGCSGAGGGFPRLAFPEGFLWGTATAAHQVEGGNVNNDWWAWEQTPGHIANGDVSGDAADHYHRFDDDFALAEAMGNNAHRLSIEWSRVEPSRDVRDEEAIAHYHEVFDSLAAHGMIPIVTLSHFTLPLWVSNPLDPASDLDGWFSAATQAEFAEFAGEMAAEFGGQVDLWTTFNEPMVSTVAAAAGQFPPDTIAGPSLDETLRNATDWVLGMIFAHASAYDAIHLGDVVDADADGTAASVGIAQHMIAFAPADGSLPEHVAAAAWLDHVFNRLFVDAVVLGNLDVNLDGDTDDLDTVPPEGNHPSLTGKLDWIGLNYYRRMEALPATPPLQGFPQDDHDYPSNELGWSIDPEGMRLSLRALGGYGLPVLVTENGIPDAADDRRPSFLVDHLVSVHRAIEEGIPVAGYMHWSLIDNFEWAEGFGPRFGLVAVDYVTQTRTPRPSYDLYAEICRENALTPRLQDRHRTIE